MAYSRETWVNQEASRLPRTLLAPLPRRAATANPSVLVAVCLEAHASHVVVESKLLEQVVLQARARAEARAPTGGLCLALLQEKVEALARGVASRAQAKGAATPPSEAAVAQVAALVLGPTHPLALVLAPQLRAPLLAPRAQQNYYWTQTRYRLPLHTSACAWADSS